MKIILEKWIYLSGNKDSGDPTFKQTTAKMAIHDGKHGYVCLKYHGGKITYHFDTNANGRKFLFIYHFTLNRLFLAKTRRRGDAETRRRGDVETRRHGDMETWRHGDMETWRHGDMETWRHGDAETLRNGKGIFYLFLIEVFAT